MEFYGHVSRISVFVITIICVNAWQCETLNCIKYPLSLKLWKSQIEVSSKSLTVKAGSSFSITCDGSCVGSLANPHLRWYGPDKYWIAYEGAENRVHVEQSFSRRFQKLHIRKVAVSDEGEYICRGWLGKEYGWDLKSIKLIVEPPGTTPLITTTSIDLTTVQTLAISSSSAVVASSTPSSLLSTTLAPKSSSSAPPGTTGAATTSTTTAAATTETKTTTTGTTEIFTSRKTTEQPCMPPNFRCGSGECFEQSLVCDSFPDCFDHSDEHNCEKTSMVCTEDMQACKDGHGCVSKNQICDGITHCRDGSDENPNVCNYNSLK